MDFSSDQPGRGKVLLKLFISTFYLSAFTFGGGYVIVTLMKRKFVDEYHWIEEQEMLDLVAIAHCSGLQAGRNPRPSHFYPGHYSSAVYYPVCDIAFLYRFS